MAGRNGETYALVMTRQLVLAVVAVCGFGAFSLWVVATRGYFGFVSVAREGGWGLQMLIDLVIALGFATSWMIRDARTRRITSWPFVAATALLGSLGVLAYCVRRVTAAHRP
jgi:hypothetical protein